MSGEAHAAWSRRYRTRQIEFARDETKPFSLGRRLGGGGVGTVYEVCFDGIPMALKQTWTRRVTERDLNELQIFGRMSERRHHHIVELVGSYTQQSRFFEIGILMWPVAHTDLSAVLHDFTVFTDYSNSVNVFPPPHDADDVRSAMISLQFMLPEVATTQALFEQAADLLHEGGRRIRQSAGCIASAISFLHHHRIRHKDLKPSQVLLSSNGLWITDFGWSRDMSNLDQSTTSGGDNITLKYQAPERANGLRCGWPEDVFTLGCIFFELGYAVSTRWWPAVTTTRPWLERGWYFHTHLDDVHDWLHIMRTGTSNLFRISLGGFLELVFQMLAAEPEDRPSLSTISSILCGGNGQRSYFTSVDFREFSCQNCYGIQPQAFPVDIEIPPPSPPSDTHYSQHDGPQLYYEDSMGEEYIESQFYALDDDGHDPQYHGAAADMSGLWSVSSPNAPAEVLQLPPELPQSNNQTQRLVDPGANNPTPIQMWNYRRPGDSLRDVPLQIDESQAFQTRFHGHPYEEDLLGLPDYTKFSHSPYFSGEEDIQHPIVIGYPTYPLPTTGTTTDTLQDPTSFQNEHQYYSQAPSTFYLAHYSPPKQRLSPPLPPLNLVNAPEVVNDIVNDTISCPVRGCNATFHGRYKAGNYARHHTAKHSRASRQRRT
ncbi:hypothetical protein J1614_000853 [Plenodomus biglobosus]|nr:hypothetical protein J1614_000853 [Plenodomus biglobosus]